ncbi:MAG TPA: hypothetical protein PKM47_18055, partial [Mycobacterium sp.]|nr:hypothetical protein [Mycobacterium sp.]
ISLAIHGGDHPRREIDVDPPRFLIYPARRAPVDDVADVLPGVESLVKLSCLHIWLTPPGEPASWWISDHPRLDGTRPRDLIGGQRQDDLVLLASDDDD